MIRFFDRSSASCPHRSFEQRTILQFYPMPAYSRGSQQAFCDPNDEVATIKLHDGR